MSEPVINMDEMIGFIMRNLSANRDIELTYREVAKVLELEEAFLRNKGIIEDEK